MRCCIALLICITLLYVSRVEPDQIELNEFFKTLQHHGDILSKKVSVGGRETSINDFFNVRSAKGIKVEDSWPITKKNVNEASHLLNIVTSCEYSDYLHGYIDFVNRSVEKCVLLLKQPELTRKCYTDMVSISYKLITKNLSGMIFVLTWLQKQSKNVLSKKRDVLKIMLSLYAWMYRDVVTEVSGKENILAKLKSVKTKTLQTRFYLKRFDIINCDPPVAVVGVNHGTGSVTETPNVTSVKKVPIMYDNGTTSTFFVFSPNDACYDNIISFIDSFNSDRTFEKNSVFRVKLAEVNDRLKSVSDVGEIVDYEMLLLQFITKTINSIVISKLQQIMKVSGLSNTDRHGQCVVSLQEVIRDYIIRFKADDQPSYLIDRMILIEQIVWLICYKMKSTDVTVQNLVNKSIESWRLSAGNLKTDEKLTDLKSALEMLSKYPICSILHPSITNVHLGQAYYYYDTNIFRYMVDFKHIQQKLVVLEENSDTLCSQILGLRKIVEIILPYIDNCHNFTESADSVSNSCFIDINDKCKQLRDSVLVIIKNFFPNEVTDWQKMYLLLNFNMSNVIMYHSKSSNLKGSMNCQRKQNFHRLFLDMDNFLGVQYHIYCGYKDSFLFKDLEYEKKSTRLSPANNGNENKVNSSEAAANLDTSTHTYHEYFQYFIKFTDHVANHHDLDEKLRLYWDGGQQSIREANISLKKYSFDLQDGYYSQDFIVKWILSVMYTRIRDVIDVMLSYGYKLKDSDLEALKGCLKPVYENLPLFLFQVTEYVVNRFLLVVIDFNDDNLDELKHFRTLLESQLEFIGIVPDSVPNVLHSQNVSERINSLKTTIELLVMIYNDSNLNYHSNIDDVLKTLKILLKKEKN